MEKKEILNAKIALAVMALAVGLLQLFVGYGLPAGLANVLWVIKVAAIIMIIQEGTLLRSTIYLILLSVGLVVLVIGALLKIMHWPHADQFLTIALCGIPFIYGVRYMLKPVKKVFDTVKVFFVAVTMQSALFQIMHWMPSREMYVYLSSGSFVLLMGYYIYELVGQRKEQT